MRAVTTMAASMALALASTAAHAGLSETVTVTNDNDFRGISQSAQDVAVQASVDYSTDFGWYVGAWMSNQVRRHRRLPGNRLHQAVQQRSPHRVLGRHHVPVDGLKARCDP